MSQDLEELPKCKTVKTLFSFDTEYSADSVEWCPHAPLQNVFVCGNYQLAASDVVETDKKTERLGRILLLSISLEEGLVLHETIDTAAILDLKFCHVKVDNQILLGAVNAAKTIEIYALNANARRLNFITKYVLNSDDTAELLLLSLDWSTGKLASDQPNIVVSDSKGNINLFKFAENRLELTNSWHGHDYEAWIAAFYYWDPNIFFTGGDDSILTKFDVRTGNAPLLKNKSHEAGVTSIHSNCKKEFILATGSYDSHLRLWDIRKMKSPLSVLKMPGTLWRLKWDPFSHDFLLAACMLGGAHIINTKTLDSPEIIDSYYEHKNITYGGDWCYLSENDVGRFEYDVNRIIGTCSFYDHLLCISKLKIK